MTVRSSSVTVVAGVIVMIIAPSCRPRPGAEPGPFNVTISESGLVSIDARSVPASRILAVLQERHGIRVDVADFRDTTVTASLRNVSLDSLLSRILPRDARAVVVSAQERELAANRGDKPGRRVTKEAGLPRKQEPGTPTDRPNLPRKPASTDTLVRPPTGAQLKGAATLDPPPPGAPTKQAIARPSQPDSVVWLSLTISGNAVTVDGARLIEGPRIVSTVPQGTYVYVVFAGNRPIAVESFYDPFEQRAYAPRPQDPHQTARSATGQFVATFALDAIRGVSPAQVALRVYTIPPGARLPRIEPGIMETAIRDLVPVATLSGERMANAIAPLLR